MSDGHAELVRAAAEAVVAEAGELHVRSVDVYAQ
jgi:hypothetical protein